jgi:hypothetical protein
MIRAASPIPACRDFLDDPQLNALARHVGRPHGVTIHHRLGERRGIDVADDILGENSTEQGRRQWNPLCRQPRCFA